MLKWWIGRRLAAFERAHGYDMGYAREILDADVGALMAFSKVAGLAAYRKGVPRDAYYAAKVAGTLIEDCGPCTQLVVHLAEREGVAPEVLRAVLAADVPAMPEDVALAYRFARAVLDHAPEADALRDQVAKRWGRRGLVSLAFAITSARLFPTLKYALGHAQACTRVTVGGVITPVARPQSVA